jgi:hypothetical protein
MLLIMFIQEWNYGNKFNANITYINSKVMFVKTEEWIVGRLYPEDIKGDRFNYNDSTLSFNGKNSKKKLRIVLS